MEDENKAFIAAVIVGVFVMVVSFTALYVQNEITTGNLCGCVLPIQYLIPLLGSVGFITGVIVYHMTHARERAKPQDKDLEKMLALVPEEERKIVELILKNKEISQSKIGKETGFSKVKVHRIVKKLHSMGIVEIKKKGKTNIVSFSKQA
ncbi:hypothetical protein DRN74_02685 [Candidatus Micrarchaeota archaeon]|nr:MAG: hypothetical protein DRN74_02685 [Candidatus Micrarchaeota archaeon]